MPTSDPIAKSTITDGIENIPQFGGKIHYVDGGAGSDTNGGNSPNDALLTIGQGFTNASAGDAINIKAGTYTETGLTLGVAGTKDYLEMWCEIGTLLDPASGNALTIAGNSCKVLGQLKITPISTVSGVVVSGAECVVEDVKVVGGLDCYSVTGAGTILNRCAAGFPAAGGSGYSLAGARTRLRGCNTVGNTTTYGYKISGNVDTGVLEDCTSVGHQTSGFYIATGSQDWTLLRCSSGAGDGRWVDVDHANVWSNFSYDDEVHSVTTFAGIPTVYNIFKLTGSVRISSIYGSVETVIPNTASTIYLQLYSSNGIVDMTDAPGVDINQAVQGALLVRNGPSTSELDLANPNALPKMAENTDWRDPNTFIDIVKDNGADTYVRLVLSAALASGAIDWHCHWEPLSDDGFLEAV